MSNNIFSTLNVSNYLITNKTSECNFSILKIFLVNWWVFDAGDIENQVCSFIYILCFLLVSFQLNKKKKLKAFVKRIVICKLIKKIKGFVNQKNHIKVLYLFYKYFTHCRSRKYLGYVGLTYFDICNGYIWLN